MTTHTFWLTIGFLAFLSAVVVCLIALSCIKGEGLKSDEYWLNNAWRICIVIAGVFLTLAVFW